jgi:anaerobic selenocysteine-containing dehydrogenase
MEPLTTSCPLDCPDACALTVRSDRGRLVLEGRGDHPVTAGFICSKVARFDRRLDHPDRVLYPARRRGPKGEGRFERIGWEDAIAEIAARLTEVARRHGSEAILPYHYGGSNGLLSEGFLDALVFARLGASGLAKTICAAPSGAVAQGMYGRMPGVAYEDYPEARMIVLWGANPQVSHIHLVPFLKRARQNGALVAVVDPVRVLPAAEVDLHLPILPGTDLPVALALVHQLGELGAVDHGFLRRWARNAGPVLERARDWPPERAAREAGVPVADLERLAQEYATRGPAVLRTGWGLERNWNGGQALAAILALPALAGKLGVRGGGYTMSNSGAFRFDAEQVLGSLPAPGRTLDMTQLGRCLDPAADLAPPVMALFVYNSNPAATTPDQIAVLRGLAREDLFTVVSEQVMTDTARYADILLPATTFLEHWDLRTSYGNYAVGGIRPVVPRRGEARPNVELFAALGRALGMGDAALRWDEETCFRRVAEALSLEGRPGDVDRLAGGDSQPVEFDGGGPVQLGNVLPRTADGKIDLAPPALGDQPFAYRPPAADFPLALITPGSPRRISSTLGELATPVLELTLHPEDGRRRGLRPGDPVRVWNHLGEVRCPVRFSERVRPGVAVLPKGAWCRTSANGWTSTALIPDTVSPVGPGACFNDARVEVERAAGGPSIS